MTKQIQCHSPEFRTALIPFVIRISSFVIRHSFVIRASSFVIWRTMFPRGRPDIGWRDLCAALVGCLSPDDRAACEARAATAFGAGPGCLTCLSVRSAWDLVCQTMAWPRGSEVIVSAINLDDMLHIARHHGLVPIPIDVDPVTLAVDPAELEKAVTGRTRAILVAHLFGSRMPLEHVAAAAARHNLLLIEDCAQAFSGDGFRGHPASDVSLFSFGPIKTRTALGGAIAGFRDPELRRRVDSLQAEYPIQRRLEFSRRVVNFILLKGLTTRSLFSIFAAGCHALGIDYDAVLQNAVRGFGRGSLIERIRRQPATPLVRLLARRLETSDSAGIRARAAYGARVQGSLAESIAVGRACEEHTHWVLPIRSGDPTGLIARLRRAGFDATRGASRLCAISQEGRSPPPMAATLIDQIVYLPMWPRMRESDITRMIVIVAAAELEPVSSNVDETNEKRC